MEYKKEPLRLGWVLFLELLAGLVPLAETPRSAIINCRLCHHVFVFKSHHGKAFCSHKTAPTLKPVQIHGIQKRTPPTWMGSFLELLAGLEPATC